MSIVFVLANFVWKVFQKALLQFYKFIEKDKDLPSFAINFRSPTTS